MTISLDNVAIQAFSDEFIAVFQAQRRLMGTVRHRSGIVGKSYEWKKIGTTEMELRGSPQSLIPASDVDHTPIVTLFKQYVLNLPTDVFQQAEVNADEQSELIMVHAKAAGRRQDQFILDALRDSATSNVILDGGTNMTLLKLIESSEVMNEENVPMGERHFAISAKALSAMLRDPLITSIEYNTVKALVSGDIDTFMGFKFHIFGKMGTGGLPLVGNIRTCFAWSQMAAGEAYNIDPTVNLDFSVERCSDIAVGKLSGGASTILDEGIVKVNIDESVV